MTKSTPTAKWAFGYCVFLVALFTICTATVGLTATIWGFVIGFTACTVAALALWWLGERQYQKYAFSQEENSATRTAVLQAEETITRMAPQNAQSPLTWVSLTKGEADLLETSTQELIERVEELYPLIEQHHIHAIVRTVMVELFCKHTAPTPLTTLASILAAKMERAA